MKTKSSRVNFLSAFNVLASSCMVIRFYYCEHFFSTNFWKCFNNLIKRFKGLSKSPSFLLKTKTSLVIIILLLLFEICLMLYLLLLGYCTEYNVIGRVIQENYNADCTTHDLPCPLIYNSAEAYKCKF